MAGPQVIERQSRPAQSQGEAVLNLSGRVSGFTAQMRCRQCDEVRRSEPADEARLRVI